MGYLCRQYFGGQELVEELGTQDNTYTVTEMNPDGSRTVKLATAIGQSLAVEDDRHRCLSWLPNHAYRLSDHHRGLLSDQATGALLTDNALIIHDIEHPENPKTALGLIVTARPTSCSEIARSRCSL